MDSISKDCNDLKKEYDSCFNKWYTEKFLKGTGDNDPCSVLFKEYQSCVLKAIKDKGIDVDEVMKKHFNPDYKPSTS